MIFLDEMQLSHAKLLSEAELARQRAKAKQEEQVLLYRLEQEKLKKQKDSIEKQVYTAYHPVSSASTSGGSQVFSCAPVTCLRDFAGSVARTLLSSLLSLHPFVTSYYRAFS